MQGSPRAKRSPSGDAVFVDDVEEGVGRLELHLASVKLLETSDEEDTTTGDYYVRSRRFEVLRCLRRDSWSSHDAGGGFLLDFELFRTASGRRGVSEGPRSRRWRRHGTAVPPRRRRDPTRVYVVITTPSSDRDAPRRSSTSARAPRSPATCTVPTSIPCNSTSRSSGTTRF